MSKTIIKILVQGGCVQHVMSNNSEVEVHLLDQDNDPGSWEEVDPSFTTLKVEYDLEPDFESWSKSELADFLVDKEVYSSLEEALLSDRSDLISECEENS